MTNHVAHAPLGWSMWNQLKHHIWSPETAEENGWRDTCRCGLLPRSLFSDLTVAKQIMWQETVTWSVQVSRSLAPEVGSRSAAQCGDPVFSPGVDPGQLLLPAVKRRDRHHGRSWQSTGSHGWTARQFFFFPCVAHLETGSMNIRCLPADADSPEKCKHRGLMTCGRLNSADVFCSCLNRHCVSAFECGRMCPWAVLWRAMESVQCSVSSSWSSLTNSSKSAGTHFSAP